MTVINDTYRREARAAAKGCHWSLDSAAYSADWKSIHWHCRRTYPNGDVAAVIIHVPADMSATQAGKLVGVRLRLKGNA